MGHPPDRRGDQGCVDLRAQRLEVVDSVEDFFVPVPLPAPTASEGTSKGEGQN